MILSIGITKILIAILILGLGLIVGNLLSKLVRKILFNVKLDNSLKAYGIKIPLEGIISTVIKHLIYIIALFIALYQFGLSTTLLYIILITILIIIISVIIVALKNFLPNLISGVIISKQGMIKKGNRIEINSVEGIVIELNILVTKVLTDEKEIVFIPNSIMLRKILYKKKSKKQQHYVHL